MIKSGKEVLPYLAEIYQQLYLTPGSANAENYRQIVLQGEAAPDKDLSHFRMHENDRLEMLETPAGSVMAVTLNERADFEMFLCIMVNKCNLYEIPASQGASILDGVINWQKIRKHKEEWLQAQAEKRILFPDWGEEFGRFTSDKANYKDALIVLSVGPYSNIPASVLGFTEKEWLEHSHIIRKYHECTHFLCRRMFPDQIDAVWDEVTADAVGIMAAFGRFDPVMAERFLGISGNGYSGGRLGNYIDNTETIEAEAIKIHGLIAKIAGMDETEQYLDPFVFAIKLEKKKQEWWPQTLPAN